MTYPCPTLRKPYVREHIEAETNGRHFADDIFKCIFFNENAWISLNISLKFVPKVRINNIPALVQIMAWRRSGDKPLSEPMMVRLPTHICVARPQWVKDTLDDTVLTYLRQWWSGSHFVKLSTEFGQNTQT